MKNLVIFIFSILLVSCMGNETSSKNYEAISTTPITLKVGGVYAFKKEESTYYITKIIAIDNFAVHIRSYSDTLSVKPNETFNTNKLNILLGHSPIDKKGYLSANPIYITEEPVIESELEGYKMYLEAMGN